MSKLLLLFTFNSISCFMKIGQWTRVINVLPTKLNPRPLKKSNISTNTFGDLTKPSRLLSQAT